MELIKQWSRQVILGYQTPLLPTCKASLLLSLSVCLSLCVYLYYIYIYGEEEEEEDIYIYGACIDIWKRRAGMKEKSK